MNGDRGVFLLLFGFIHLILGWAYMDPSGGQAVLLSWLPNRFHLPIELGAVPWAVSAMVAVWAAFRRPPRRDGAGFEALVAVHAGWTVLYLLSWVSGAMDRGWVGAAIYAGLGGAVLVVSGMVSAGDMVRVDDARQSA